MMELKVSAFGVNEYSQLIEAVADHFVKLTHLALTCQKFGTEVVHERIKVLSDDMASIVALPKVGLEEWGGMLAEARERMGLPQSHSASSRR